MSIRQHAQPSKASRLHEVLSVGARAPRGAMAPPLWPPNINDSSFYISHSPKQYEKLLRAMEVKVQLKSVTRYLTAQEVAYYFGSRYMKAYNEMNTVIPKGIREYVRKFYDPINELLADVDDKYRWAGNSYLAPAPFPGRS